jgi:glycosyltransferase involved in cell wall biosynthesis
MAAPSAPADSVAVKQALTRRLQVLLVDPSLFTAPYDAALTQGLLAADVDPMWATRPKRARDRQELPLERTDPFFYRRVDEARWIPARLKSLAKGLAHFTGLLTLLWRVYRTKPDVVHFQWIVVPPLDVMAMAVIRRWCPLVLTVHDTVPFNGQKMTALQRFGHDGPTRQAHRLIVHTRSGRQALIDRGIPAAKIVVVAHGALALAVPLPTAPAPRDPRWTFLMFGEIKPYKGLDVLVEAVRLLPEPVRQGLRIVLAGRPRMDMDPVLGRIRELGLDAQFDLRLHRQSEEEMASLFDEADCFLFPYLQIDASGVYFLVKSLGKWMIASRIGIFAEDLVEGIQGELVPAADAKALALAMQSACLRRPACEAVSSSDAWADIGRSTRALYEQVVAESGSSTLANVPLQAD